MDNSFFQLPRELLSDPIWLSMSLEDKIFFITVAVTANFKPAKFNDYGKIIDLEVGEACRSYPEWAELCGKGFTSKKIEHSAKRLFKVGFLGVRLGGKRNILKVKEPITYNLMIENFGRISGRILGGSWEDLGRIYKEEAKNEEERKEGASERANEIKIEHIGQHNVQNQTGQNLPADSLASRSPLLSEEKKQDLSLLTELCFYEKLSIKENDLEQWVRKYPGGYIADHIQELIKRQKNPNNNIANQAAWMTSALHRNYTQEQKNILINREFAHKFKSENNWNELDVLQKYCTLERSGYDLQFKLDPKDFKKFLIQKYKNCVGVA